MININNMETLPEAVSADEAARRLTLAGLPVTAPTITRWIKLGRIRAARITPTSPFRIPETEIGRILDLARVKDTP